MYFKNAIFQVTLSGHILAACTPGFSYDRDKDPLERNIAFTYGLHYMAGLYARAQGVPVGCADNW